MKEYNLNINIMKNLLFISFLFLSFIFSSCSSDDDAPIEPTNAELILGKWNVESLSDSPALDACVKQSSFEFFDDNTLSVISYGYNGSDACVALATVSGDYDFTFDNEILLTAAGAVQRLEIVVLTDNKFIFSYVDTGSGETVFSTFRK